MGNNQNINNKKQKKQYEIPFNKILNNQIEKNIKRNAKTPNKLNEKSNHNSKIINNNKSFPNIHKFYKKKDINNKTIESIDFLINYIYNKNTHINKHPLLLGLFPYNYCKKKEKINKNNNNNNQNNNNKSIDMILPNDIKNNEIINYDESLFMTKNEINLLNNNFNKYINNNTNKNNNKNNKKHIHNIFLNLNDLKQNDINQIKNNNNKNKKNSHINKTYNNKNTNKKEIKKFSKTNSNFFDFNKNNIFNELSTIQSNEYSKEDIFNNTINSNTSSNYFYEVLLKEMNSTKNKKNKNFQTNQNKISINKLKNPNKNSPYRKKTPIKSHLLSNEIASKTSFKINKNIYLKKNTNNNENNNNNNNKTTNKLKIRFSMI